jgi:hypothetical protein
MVGWFSFYSWYDRLLTPFAKKRHASVVARRFVKGRPAPRLGLEELEDRLAPAMPLSIADASVLEPAAGGHANMDFTVTRIGDLTPPLTVGYTTVAGTAQPGTDFTPQTGTVTFAAGAATATISIPVVGNGVYNYPDLTFSVKLLDFLPQVTFATDKRPLCVAVGDINGDGKPDLVTANYSSNTISVLRNTTPPGAVVPSFAAQQTFACGKGPSAVAVADVDGDGKPDVVVVDLMARSLTVLLNTTALGASTPTFASPASFPTGIQPTGLAVGDLNGDGKPDFAVANAGSSTASVFINRTPPGAAVATFAPRQSVSTGRLAAAIAIGDINADGKPDLVIATGDRVAYVYMDTTTPGAAAASFAVPKTFETSLVRPPVGLVMGDVNGDGRPDLVFADDVNYASVLTNATAPGVSTPAFNTSATIAAGGSPASVAVADVTGDGKPDLVFADAGGAVVVLPNLTVPGATIPTFAPRNAYAAGSHPAGVAVADVNSDGLPDLVAANPDENTVSVLLRQKDFGTFTRTVATGTIRETDLPVAQLKSATLDVNVSAGTFSIAVSLAPASHVAVTIPFSLGGTAAAGVDYSGLTPSPLVIAPGQTSATITGNVLVPPPGLNKTLIVTLGTPTNAQLGPSASQTVTFVQPNTLSIANASALEPPPGDTAMMTFTATRTGDASATTIAYATAPGSAQPGTDFTPRAGTATFAAGSATATFDIPIIGNGVVDQPDLTFSVALAGFGPPAGFKTDDGPVAVAAGDFNGDGKPDLAVANRYAGTMSVLLNTTAAGAVMPTFAAAKTFSAGSLPFAIAVADFNGDGKPDIVVDNSTGRNLSLFLNKTAAGALAPSFASQTVPSVNGYSASVAVGDINGDGKPDLAVVDSSNDLVAVLLNTTAAGAQVLSFAARQAFAAGTGLNDVKIADVNGDGRPDLVVAASNTVAVLLNMTAPASSTLQFGDPATFLTGSKSRFVGVGDLNRDGRPDVIATSSGDNTVAVFMNLTPPGAAAVSFAFKELFATGNNPVSVAAVDVNGDNNPDLVFVNNSTDASVSVLLNLTPPGNAVGVFAPQQTFASGNFPFSLAVADFNGDARPDLAVTTANPSGVGRTFVNVLLDAPITATGTIIDTDPHVAFATGAQSVNETDVAFSATVNLSSPSPRDAVIPFTLGGTAAPGKNYSGVTAGPLVIRAGQTSGTITGTLINDKKFDNVDKTLTITLGPPTDATLGDVTTDTITIRESLPPPAIPSVSLLEGTGGLTPFEFHVSLPAPAPFAVTYNYFTTDGTAQEGVNYVGTSATAPGTVTFLPGQVSQTITIPVVAGSIPVTAGLKTFSVSLTDPRNPSFVLASGTGTIIPQSPSSNGTAKPRVTINNISQLEGKSGLTPFVFQVRLTAVPAKAVTLDLFTTDGTALAGTNYVGIAAGDNSPPVDIGTVTFAAGQISKTITVYVKAGSVPVTAGTKTFTVSLSDPSDPGVALASGVATIIAQ